MIALAALLMVQAIPSDAATGSRIRQPAAARAPDGAMNESDRARTTLDAFGSCVVGRHRRLVERALSLPSEAAVRGAAARLADDECLGGGRLRFSSGLMVGALYGALYKVDFPTAPAQPVAATPVITSEAVLAMPQVDQDAGALRLYADCVVRARPRLARMAVVAPIGTSNDTAFEALQPALKACMPEGQTLNLSKSLLSGLLAEMLYREGKAGGA